MKPMRQIQEIVTIQLYYFGDFKISHFVVCESEEEKRASPSPALLLPTARLRVAPPSLPGEERGVISSLVDHASHNPRRVIHVTIV